MKIQMAKTGFQVIPEGEYVFRIDSAKYDEVFGSMEIKLSTKEGYKHSERYQLMTEKGETNDGALVAFSFMAKAALNNFDLDECDPDELVGKYFSATVEHDVKPNRNDPKKTVTFVKLNNKAYAEGFAADNAQGVDIDSLLD